MFHLGYFTVCPGGWGNVETAVLNAAVGARTLKLHLYLQLEVGGLAVRAK